MKIVLLNSTNTGGAGIACIRLAEALEKQGHTVNVLVQKEKNGGHRLTTPILSSKLSKVPYLLRQKKQDRWLSKYPDKQPMFFSIPLGSSKVYKHPLIVNADVVHIHWASDGFISTKDLDTIAKLKGKVFLTFHDMWYMTGGCHYAGTCNKFMTHCGSCPLLGSTIEHDLTYKIFEEKLAVYPNISLHVITPSKWMADLAKQSLLFKDKPINHIPNCHNFNVFKPIDKREAANTLRITAEEGKKHVLFGAVSSVHDTRKGFKYLQEALAILDQDANFDSNNIELLIFGSSKAELQNELPFKTTMLGNILSETMMANVYNMADVFVAPSLEDNLPNTLIEAMGCGTPCVGFNVGGIPEIIDHKINGYVAEKENSNDLAEGIKYVISIDNNYAEAAVSKAISTYSYKKIAQLMMAAYNPK